MIQENLEELEETKHGLVLEALASFKDSLVL
jgi:hypothetical protein